MRVVVTGGAGYIGSVVVERLIASDHDVVVLDNLWRGHLAALDPQVAIENVDLRDLAAVENAVRTKRPDAIMHFAAATLVPESVADPLLYYDVNVGGSLNLIKAARASHVPRFVFSSTAAVYGIPRSLPIRESAELAPVNPYGASKLAVERLLEDLADAGVLSSVRFRYFNVAGATERRGEDHDPETHLIPSALRALRAKDASFAIFGSDYDTPDGTAVRDYVHVADLADAHVRALELLDRPLGPINLGTAFGFSVRQVVDALQEVTGKTLDVRLEPRRAGDPPSLLADSSRARSVLGWMPSRSTLSDMIGSTWDWMQRHPEGYRS